MSIGNTNVPKPTNSEHSGETCNSVRETLSFVGDKWSVLIVFTLDKGPLRFNELRNGIDGISQRMLTRSLRNLERNGILKRTVVGTVPPSVYYELTDLGKTFLHPVTALTTWARASYPQIKLAQEDFDKQNSV